MLLFDFLNHRSTEAQRKNPKVCGAVGRRGLSLFKSKGVSIVRVMRVLIFLWVFCFSASGAELWLYCQQNLWVDQNIEKLEGLFARAGKAGYTHVLLADSKFAKLGDMDGRYFKNVERLKKAAGANGLEIVPAVFPVGYSNDILWHDPNLV
jgi:hypothetical protein